MKGGNTMIVKEYLKYLFSEDEIKKLGNDLAQTYSQKLDAEGRLKSVSTQIKSEIAKLDMGMASDSERIRSGYEYRYIECEKEEDFTNGRITITRTDTGEMVTDRAMTSEERQKNLFDKNQVV
jgi:hypothetical protein